ncbi:MAG: aromatic ring-hydroxylating dioxygenase subunit alpha [Gammaproteobacteria bacterium]|jgi:phenylpropionate dioxygenase-like ring-hydroxylating dioxygenase large terminal subunit|nr:aromatic ring-hydroxylating dioxygenase subunit alpha [Gammaproteobacteria bacterium]MBT5601985.1 aromatic ring-hydroxylating dioxygenase subunit alpha [Gammaproteobacteria bacterium]MBT6243965.1 aromatic ring-hydroxylating dioxygenase subunit alpha [Gammaproteobacteria bacterium]
MTAKVVDYTQSQTTITNYSKTRYISSDIMDQEWNSIWQGTWLLAGLTSDLETPGDYFVFSIGTEQILVSKTSKGTIEAFYNVCQHRGNQLVTSRRGNAKSFRCAYHAWTYDHDGNLKSVPSKDRFKLDPHCENLALRKVHCAYWNGLVFINLAEQTETLESYLGPVADLLEAYHFEEMTLVQDQTVHLDCNWKAVVDNFGELYHVDFLHPQHKRMVDCRNDIVRLFKNGHTGVEVPGATVNPRYPVPEHPTDIQSSQLNSLGLNPDDFKGRVLDIRQAVQKQKKLIDTDLGMNYHRFSDDQLSDVWQYNLFPNAILSFTPEHCWILRPRPHPTDPQRCEFDKISLVKFANSTDPNKDILGPGKTSALLNPSDKTNSERKRPETDVFTYDQVINGEKDMTDTINQDVALLGGVQKGMASKGFDKVFLSDDEVRIQHFHDHLDLQLHKDPPHE